MSDAGDILHEAEGWYLDPYGRHEQRWFSAGEATALVRDGEVDGNDAPPPEPITTPLQRPAEVGRPTGDGYDAMNTEEEVWRAGFGNLGVEP
jgi:hypothetical protein